MLSRFKELKNLEESNRHKKIHSLKRVSLKSSNLKIDCNECKQAIPLPDGAYRGIFKEKVSKALCKSCPHFDQEPLEYKLFRRI
ncbi:MAG: hypothetical protein AOA66_0354 [Candidatus Bathyarchaeota archaeon BA2]|nr:MAG: hypothetical protein AOA66_0354 [Candidatus Bathyarchaeota archaeon BA2]